ncbi:MAG TPA: FAD-dependent oxidoreductase [Acidimicrobiales bacterium]|nr:FAD-dependent oxidoreductase [Acidimicrobiales bacterium]HVC69485.1 FAD-dependent oxidoreductase [Acidimicrobiales bacterium]
MADYDLIVVGGGAGGLAAARAGVRRRARTLLVQQGPLGGDCTFTGCVPSKALIEAAGQGKDFASAMAALHRTIDTIAASEDDAVLSREGVEVLHGWARFHGPGELDVDGSRIRAPRVILATGTRPALPPIPGLEGIDYLTNENVFELNERPRSLAVLGGGPIGCELAQAFARLGTQVSVLEATERLITKEEPEASDVVASALRGDGVDVRLGQKVVSVTPREAKGAVGLTLGSGEMLEADRLLVAVGRSALSEDLNLASAGVQTECGFIKTDDHLATTAKGIWAVGDVAGRLQFTHAADEMGRIAAANALSRLPQRRFQAGRIPWVTFTRPEVARIGVTEAEAAAQGGMVAYLPMTEVDRAIAAGQTEGFVKLIAGPRRLGGRIGGGRLIGATVVASRGGELIGEAALAMRTHMLVARLAQTVHPYPTWSIALQAAAAQFFMEIGGRRAHPAGGSPRGHQGWKR